MNWFRLPLSELVKCFLLNLLHCIDSTFQLTATQSQPGSQPQCKKPTQISKSVLLTNFANLPINRFLSLDSSIRIGHRGRTDKVNHLHVQHKLMLPFYRTIIASLLCGMATLGHAPAWLHLANCDHGTQKGIQKVAAQKDSVLAHDTCCCQHHSDPEPDSEGDSLPKHDHESCVICQSMAAPSGVIWQVESDLTSESLFELAQIQNILEIQSNFQSIPQPRGPPTFA